MQAQEAEQRAEAVEEAVKQPARTAVKLYIISALTAVLSFAVVSGTASKSSRDVVCLASLLFAAVLSLAYGLRYSVELAALVYAVLPCFAVSAAPCSLVMRAMLKWSQALSAPGLVVSAGMPSVKIR